jgi:tetratricopeptide (TPR) repeat protein
VENKFSVPAARPARVEAVIEQRLARLNPMLRELLDAASVEGEVFSAEIVGDVLGLDPGTALKSFTHDLGQQHQLIQETGRLQVRSRTLHRFQFHHLLIQEYLYNRLISAEKRRVHGRFAEELEKTLAGSEPDAHLDGEGLDGFGPQLLHHSWQGEEWTKAAAYAFELGKRASQRYAMREAIAYHDQALLALDRQAAPDEALLSDVLLGWQDAAFNFTPYDLQLERLSRAEEISRKLSDKPRLIRILHWKANVLLARGRWSQAGPTLAESLALAQEVGDERLSVRPLYFKALMTSFGDPVQSLGLLALAKELSRKHTDGQIEALALATEGQVRAGLGDFEGARQALDDAHVVSQRLGSPVLESDVDHFAAWAWLAMGDMAQAMEFGQRSLQTALATDNMDCTCGSIVCIGYINLELRKITEAASAFEEGVARSESAGALIHKQEGQAGLAAVRFFDGHPEALGNLQGVIQDMRGLGNLVGAAATNQMLGACLMQLGEHDRATESFNQAATFYRQCRMYPSLRRTLQSLAQLMERQGRHSEAQAYAAEAESAGPIPGNTT